MLDGILLTPLKVIHHPKGDIYHALKASSPGYQGFGEAYFSIIKKGDIKGGLLSSATGVANTLATQPFFPYARGAGALASIPLDIANVMYEPSDVGEYYESVTKRFPPKD